MTFARHINAIVAITGVASAVTTFSDAQMTDYLNAGGVDLANAYAPLWFFNQANWRWPCIPTWAFGGSPTSDDTYDDAHKTPEAPLCAYPNVGCNCRNPDKDIVHPAPPFPVYYTYARCNDNEVRVAYNLFYEKDGAIASGHGYDWERVIVVHQKDSTTSTWSPSQALLSQHSGYERHNWGDIESTLTTAQIQDVNSRGPDRVQNEDHPKVYVAWSKHAMFDTRDGTKNDPVSQSLPWANRDQDWWYFVEKKYYIRADGSTAAGQAIAKADWGEADSSPPRVHENLCSQ